ncbi:hypothetical protein GE09DRAFT_1098517 [Coniochaeta sp. 2T2.1]|nr:hypothetical protein GE09DRAFT_1098517 [Coniochaeta sp. 2T2.1]
MNVMARKQSPPEMADTQQQTGKKRTRTGCITCKIRRVKCDETKPSCLRCQAQKRTCDGYPPPSHPILSRRALALAVRSISAPGPASRVLAGPQSPDDVACFDFFRHRTAPMTGSFFPSDFWSGKLLQVAHARPAVWHAAVALGALHRRWELGFSPAKERAGGNGVAASVFYEKATESYRKSMALAKEIDDPLALLVLSLGLMAVTNILGKWVDNRVHGAAGLKLLGEIKRERAGYRGRCRFGSEMETVAESFTRMDLQNLTFSESQAPYPDLAADTNEGIRADADTFEDWLAPGDTFASLNQAGFHLFALIRRFLLFAGIEENMTPEEYSMTENSIRLQSLLWEQIMAEYLATRSSPRDGPGLLTLKLYHAFLCIFLRVDITGPETNWDRCLPHFERMIAIASAILIRNRTAHAGPAFVSLEPGIIIPLYVTATRCRHPVLRRRALELLRTANSQEGRWHSIGAAAVAERMVQVEEEGMQGLIPDDFYVGMINIDVSGDTRFHECAQARLDEETVEYWLGGDQNWTSVHSWDGVPCIPENNRAVMTGIMADIEVGRIEIEIVFSGATGVVTRKTEDVVISDWQEKWRIERSIL